MVKPIGSFRCFLRWRDHKYKVRIEVMGIDTPNVLSRETTFLMGILKKCYPVEKIPIKQAQIQTNHIPISVSDQADQLPSIKVAFSHSVPSTGGVFCHSDPSVEENLPCHSVPSTEEKSQMNCVSISETVESQEICTSETVIPITIHFQLQIYLSPKKRSSLHMQMSSKVLANSQEILTN